MYGVFMILKKTLYLFLLISSFLQAMPNRSGWFEYRKNLEFPSRTSCGNFELDKKFILLIDEQHKVISSLILAENKNINTGLRLISLQTSEGGDDLRKNDDTLSVSSDSESSHADELMEVPSVATVEQKSSLALSSPDSIVVVLPSTKSFENTSSNDEQDQSCSLVGSDAVKSNRSLESLEVLLLEQQVTNSNKKKPKVVVVASTQFPEQQLPQILSEKKGWDYLVEIKDSFSAYFAGVFALAQVPTIGGLAAKVYLMEFPRDTPRTKQEHIKAYGEKLKSMVIGLFKNPKLSYQRYSVFTVTFLSMAIADMVLLAHTYGLF